MIINLLGLKFKRNISSILKQNKRVRSFRNLEDIDNILIFFTYEDWDEISHISKNLEDKGKNIILWTIEPKKNSKYYTFPENVRVVSQKESSKINGLSQVVEEFNKLTYDTLIDLTSTDDTTLIYLLAGNKSDFCVGTRKLDYPIYDFIFLKKEDMNLVDTYQELISYIKSVFAKDAN